MKAERLALTAGGRRFEVVCVRAFEALRDWELPWEQLLAKDPYRTLFLSPQFFLASLQVSRAQPWVLVALEGGEPVALAPMVRECSRVRGIGLRTLRFGAPRGDFVVAGERTAPIEAFVRHWYETAQEWDAIELEDTPEHSGTAARVSSAAGEFAGLHARALPLGPSETFLSTTDGWDDYLRMRGHHFRKSLGYQCRRIERLGPVSYRTYDTVESVRAAFPELLELGKHSWKAASGDPLPQADRLCFESLLDDRSRRLGFELLFLDVGERAVAGLFNVYHMGRLYLFVTFYDERVRRHYPGRPLFRRALRQAFAREEVKEVSFVGSYPFARSWSQTTRTYRGLRLLAPGLRARAARLVRAALRRTPERILDPAQEAKL